MTIQRVKPVSWRTPRVTFWIGCRLAVAAMGVKRSVSLSRRRMAAPVVCKSLGCQIHDARKQIGQVIRLPNMGAGQRRLASNLHRQFARAFLHPVGQGRPLLGQPGQEQGNKGQRPARSHRPGWPRSYRDWGGNWGRARSKTANTVSGTSAGVSLKKTPRGNQEPGEQTDTRGAVKCVMRESFILLGSHKALRPLDQPKTASPNPAGSSTMSFARPSYSLYPNLSPNC